VHDSGLKVDLAGVLTDDREFFFLTVHGIQDPHDPENEEEQVQRQSQETKNWDHGKDADTYPSDEEDKTLLHVEHDERIVLGFGEERDKEQNVGHDRHTCVIGFCC